MLIEGDAPPRRRSGAGPGPAHGRPPGPQRPQITERRAGLHPQDDVARARAAVRTARVDDRLGPPVPPTSVSAWRGFVRRYGWRAYALPILAVITVAAMLRGAGGHSPARAAGPAAVGRSSGGSVAPPPAQPTSVIKKDLGGTHLNNTVLAAAALPSGAPFDATGDGTYRVLKGTTKKVGSGKLFRYSIDVENGLTGVDLSSFQHIVDTTLDDKRSWSGHGVALERVDAGPIDFHITLTSSMSVRTLCGYDIPVETSCYATANGSPGLEVNRVVLNDSRWMRGAAAYVGDLAQYRRYMVNHEDGHALGHLHAHQCLPGGLAPAMMQQTFGLRSTATDQFCEANPWPYPPGVSGAPGAEQVDTAKNNEYGRGD